MNGMYLNFCIKAFKTKEQFKFWLAQDCRRKTFLNLVFITSLALILLFAAPEVFAQQTIESMLEGGQSVIQATVSFLMNLAVVLGLGAIIYGFKLIYDKSNERENVKNSHIVFAILGGTMLLILWFVVEALTGSLGGSSSDIGSQGNFSW